MLLAARLTDCSRATGAAGLAAAAAAAWFSRGGLQPVVKNVHLLKCALQLLMLQSSRMELFSISSDSRSICEPPHPDNQWACLSKQLEVLLREMVTDQLLPHFTSVSVGKGTAVAVPRFDCAGKDVCEERMCDNEIRLAC
jgi:hypothetical protein